MAETEIFKLNLDASEFIEAIKKSSEALEGIGATNEGLQKVISGIGLATELLGTMAIAYAAVKSSIEWVEEAEQVKMVSAQFEMLSNQAGIATGELKEGLEKASHGLIDNNELMKLANKALIELGDNAKKLPEIMELARKVSATFGGELSSNFEAINQAVSTGNTRILKHMGIIVDSNKAYIEYAKSIGTTVDQLSQSGKQAAIMNAVLEKGGEAFKGVNADGQATKTTIQQINVTLKELGEVFVLVFEKTAGPVVRGVLGHIKDFATYIKDKVTLATASWGESTEIASKQIEQLESQLPALKQRLVDLESRKTGFFSLFQDEKKIDAEKKKAQNAITAIEAEINGLKAKKEELAEADEEKAGAAPKRGVDNKVDQAKHLANETAFQKDIQKLQAEALAARVANEDSIEAVEKNHEDQMTQMRAQFQEKIKEIDLRESQGKIDAHQADMMRAQERAIQVEKEAAEFENLTDRKIAALNRFSEQSDSSSEQFSAGWHGAALKAINDNSNFANMGQAAFSTIGSRATQAFKAIGSGSASAGQAMKTFFLGALGDMATKQGEMFLMQGLGFAATPGGQASGGVLIAEGAGLIALGALLGASSSGGGGTSGAGAGGGGGGGAAGVDTSGGASQAAAASEKKTVTFQVMGHVFETDQTKRVLMDLMRQETDATDFKYQQIGV